MQYFNECYIFVIFLWIIDSISAIDLLHMDNWHLIKIFPKHHLEKYFSKIWWKRKLKP